MRKKLGVLLAILLLLSALAAGCKKPVEEAGPIVYEGFSTVERLTGGAEVAEANVKSLFVAENGGDMTITFGFLSGSRLSGGANESAAADAPAYAVSMLKNPARLVVEFSSVSYWDYARDAAEPHAPLLSGFFQTRFTDDAALRFTFQLASEAVYKVEPVTGGLSVVVRPIQEAEATDAVQDITQGMRYYAVANAYRDYCNGAIPRDAGVFPALAENGRDIVMISGAFYSEAEAKNFLAALAKKNEALVEAQWEVVLLGENSAPAFSEEALYAHAYTQNVVRINGAETAAEVFLEDGLYLCHAPDKTGVLYAKRLLGGQPGVDEYAYQKIYYREGSGKVRPYLDYEFQVVEQVKFSPDGRKLAVLERDEERTHLYVFDVDARELLTDLTNMGFGELVSAFTWDSLGLSIYAVSGSGAMQVHAYDFGVPQEAKRHSVVDKNGADEGYLAYSGGELYFTDSSLATGETIYRIKPDGGVRKPFAQGGAFALSPDNRYMALSVAGASAEAKNGFSLYDMETGETTLLTDGFTVSSFLWSNSGAKLYYIENRLAGEGGEGATSGADESADTQTAAPADPYPYTLWVYDVSSKQSRSLMDLPYPWIVASDGAKDIFLNYYDSQTGGDIVRATYRLPAA